MARQPLDYARRKEPAAPAGLTRYEKGVLIAGAVTIVAIVVGSIWYFFAVMLAPWPNW